MGRPAMACPRGTGVAPACAWRPTQPRTDRTGTRVRLVTASMATRAYSARQTVDRVRVTVVHTYRPAVGFTALGGTQVSVSRKSKTMVE